MTAGMGSFCAQRLRINTPIHAQQSVSEYLYSQPMQSQPKTGCLVADKPFCSSSRSRSWCEEHDYLRCCISPLAGAC